MDMIDKFTGRYRFLSNFWPTPVRLDRVTYQSVECAYQAAKTKDLVLRQPFQVLSSHTCKDMGRRLILRPDWKDVKISIMTKLVRRKFTGLERIHKENREALLSTEGIELIEGNTWGDTFWGVCNGKGHNHLGKILMEIREELKCS